MFREKVAPTQDLGRCHLPSATGVVLGWGAFWAVGGRWAGKRVAGGYVLLRTTTTSVLRTYLVWAG